MIHRLPLRFLIPLLIMFGGGLIIASAWFFEMRAQVRSLLDVAEDQLRSNATFIAAEIEAAVRIQDFSEARGVLERAIAIPSLQSIHLVEPDGTIRFSSNRRLIGADFREEAATRDLERAIPFSLPMNLDVASDPKTSALVGRFPIQMRSRPTELMPIQSGALYLDYNLSSIVSEYRAALATRMLYRSGLLVAIAIGFWLLLRRWLLVRIDRLIASTRRVAQGDFDVGFDDHGHDELADLTFELRRMTHSLRDQTRHLEYLADHDALTGLKNRAGIESALATALRESRSCGTRFVLLLLDIDSLRVINDTQGHLAGDELLRSFGQLLTETLAEAVCIARVGGDEFAVLIDADRGEPLDATGSRLQERIRNFRFQRRGERFSVQATTGVIELSAELHDAEAALGAADAACYAAKDMERGGFVQIRSEDHRVDLVESGMGLVSQIQDALDNDRFELFAQRIEPLQTQLNQGLHFEVLLRMIDREGHPVAPGKFLAAAERYNLIGRIDRWVLRNTLARLSSLGDRIEDIEHCSINLSGASLGDTRLLGQFEDWLGAHPDFDPRRLCFEVTETAAVRNLGRARTFIERMRRSGCRFALDDFGTGLSSFEYIKQLPVDVIKIDGVFVRDLLSDPTDRIIVKAIHEIASELGIRTVAEFVENEAIADELRALGVDYGQGYGIGRPQPLTEFFAPPPRSELPGSRSGAG